MFASEVKATLLVKGLVAALQDEAEKKTNLVDAINAELAVYNSNILVAESLLQATGSALIEMHFLGQAELEPMYVAHFESLGYVTKRYADSLLISID